MGLITVKAEGDERTYVFNDRGYELLDDLLENIWSRNWNNQKTKRIKVRLGGA